MSDNPYEPSREPALAPVLPGGTGLMREGETYSLGYDIFVEDLVAFSLHRARTSPINQRNFYRGWIVRTLSLVVSFGVVFVVVIPRFNRIDSMITAAIVSIATLVIAGLYPLRYRRSLERKIRQMINQESNKTICGAWRLVASPKRLSCYMPLVESHYHWNAIETIQRTPDAIYAYVTALSAIIIPVRAFKSTAEMDAFHAVLTERNTAAGKLL